MGHASGGGEGCVFCFGASGAALLVMSRGDLDHYLMMCARKHMNGFTVFSCVPNLILHKSHTLISTLAMQCTYSAVH